MRSQLTISESTCGTRSPAPKPRFLESAEQAEKVALLLAAFEQENAAVQTARR